MNRHFRNLLFTCILGFSTSALACFSNEESSEQEQLRKELAELKNLVLKLSSRIEEQEEQLADLKKQLSHPQETTPPETSLQACETEEDQECTVCQKPEDFPKLDVFSDLGIWGYACDESLRIGGFIQADGTFFLNSDAGKSTFLIRRARLFATGTLCNLFSFMIMPRWDRNKAELHYAYIDTLSPSYFKIRVGLFKEPFSMESLYMDVYWDFEERSMGIINYHQIEDMGVMAFGKLADDRVQYGFGIFNGRGRELDNNQNKEVVGRLVVTPFDYDPFKRFYVGVSGSSGKNKENLTDQFFRTETDTHFWRWVGSDKHSVKVNAHRFKWGADFEWLNGPMALRSECIHVDWGHVKRGHLSRRFTGWGWYSEGAYILTGEEKPRNRPLAPYRNFDINCAGGAFEIVGRYEVFYASKDVLDAGLATGANKVNSITLGANWYLNPYVVLRLNVYEWWFNRKFVLNDHDIDRESAITGRVQAEF